MQYILTYILVFIHGWRNISALIIYKLYFCSRLVAFFLVFIMPQSDPVLSAQTWQYRVNHFAADRGESQCEYPASLHGSSWQTAQSSPVWSQTGTQSCLSERITRQDPTTLKERRSLATCFKCHTAKSPTLHKRLLPGGGFKTMVSSRTSQTFQWEKQHLWTFHWV